MSAEVLTHVGGLSLFQELELDSADEEFNDYPLKDVLLYEKLVDCIITHIGSSSLFPEHVMATNLELEVLRSALRDCSSSSSRSPSVQVGAPTVVFNAVYFDPSFPSSTTLSSIRQFPELTMAGFADALRLDKFTGVHFKRWQIKATLWLTHLKLFQVSNGLPEGTISDQDQNKFKEDNTLFVGCVLSILADRLCDVYMHIVDGKELWDALNAKFDAGSELYIMESFHDIRMVNNHSVVEQAHEIQCIAKEIELLKCALPDKFVAGCIIAKLPPSWRNFATTLKHKR
ncbi:hypothetical protein QYE76_053758 [Lolium multiflorum]|uniref:Uncharacterized protein n=1 Tax=Lolium multiflorum TaxID=4521 RepID=A0AAD8SX02_LOLMU|nr:hypothetical protein QYE76_053758 [Lolium multiflorum]